MPSNVLEKNLSTSDILSVAMGENTKSIIPNQE